MAMRVQGGQMVPVTTQQKQVINRVKSEVFKAERELVKALQSMKSVARSTNDAEALKAATDYLDMMNRMQGTIRALTV